MEEKDNPLLQPEDFFAGYKESIEKLKQDPNLILFDKLCYEVFSTEHGKKLLELAKDRYLIPAIVDRGAPNYAQMVIWADGFKDSWRMIIGAIASHDQRIKAGVNP
jgi:hypothetical protein